MKLGFENRVSKLSLKLVFEIRVWNLRLKLGFELYVVTWFFRIRFFYLTLKIRSRNLKNSCRRNGPLKITLTGFLVLVWKLKKAWGSGSILLQFIWIPNIMKLQMFSILITLMKKQRLKSRGKLYFLTISCSLYFLSK